MQHEHYKNVRNSKLPLRTFGIFTIILLMGIGATWWITCGYYDKRDITDRMFLRLDSSLNTSINFLKRDCVEDSIYVGNKSRQPGYEKILILYKPKIDSVMLLARSMHNYIQSLNDLYFKNHTDADLTNKSEQIRNEKLFNAEVNKNLYDSLAAYSTTLLKILPFKIQYFNVKMPIDATDLFSKNAELWLSTYFNKSTPAETLSTLTNLDYKVWLSANEMIEIIRSQWSDDLQLDDRFYYFLTSVNSNYFLPGQTLEMSVGLGAYVTNIKPQIFISGQEQPVNAQGYAFFKTAITGGKGGIIPIIISYKDLNTGKILTMSKQVSYTVLQGSKK